jgi:hypothetical protein
LGSFGHFHFAVDACGADGEVIGRVVAQSVHPNKPLALRDSHRAGAAPAWIPQPAERNFFYFACEGVARCAP